MEDSIIYPNESFNVIGAALEVHNTIGCGFTEPIYQDAFEIELQERGIPYQREKVLPITYKGKQLNKYFRVDFVCYDKIIVELKAATAFTEEHYSQVYNYLKASGHKVGLLINFGKKSLEYKRIPCVTKWQ